MVPVRIPHLPDVVREWRDKHPGEQIPDGLVLTQPWPATSSEKARGIPDRVVHYQFRHDRARRTLRGIDEQVAKAERAVEGKAPVKRNRYIQLTGATKSVNRQLEAKTRALAGWKGYTTNLTGDPRSSSSAPTTSCGASRKLPDVQARPGGPTDLPPQTRIHRRPPDHRVRRARRHPLDRTPNRLEHQEIRPDRPPLPHRQIQAGSQTLTAADPPPDDLSEALAKITAGVVRTSLIKVRMPQVTALRNLQARNSDKVR